MCFQRLNLMRNCKEIVLLSLLRNKRLLGPRQDNLYYLDRGLLMQRVQQGIQWPALEKTVDVTVFIHQTKIFCKYFYFSITVVWPLSSLER